MQRHWNEVLISTQNNDDTHIAEYEMMNWAAVERIWKIFEWEQKVTSHDLQTSEAIWKTFFLKHMEELLEGTKKRDRNRTILVPQLGHNWTVNHHTLIEETGAVDLLLLVLTLFLEGKICLIKERKPLFKDKALIWRTIKKKKCMHLEKVCLRSTLHRTSPNEEIAQVMPPDHIWADVTDPISL